MKFFLAIILLSPLLVAQADPTVRASSAETDSASCMVSSTYGYGCETGSGCLTPENAAQVIKPEESTQKAE